MDFALHMHLTLFYLTNGLKWQGGVIVAKCGGFS